MNYQLKHDRWNPSKSRLTKVMLMILCLFFLTSCGSSPSVVASNSLPVPSSQSINSAPQSEPAALGVATSIPESNTAAFDLSQLKGVWYYEESSGSGQLVLMENAFYDFGYYYSEYFPLSGGYTVEGNTISFDFTGNHFGETAHIQSVVEVAFVENNLQLTLVSGDRIFILENPGDSMTYLRGDNSTFTNSQVQADLTLLAKPVHGQGEIGLRVRSGPGTDYEELVSVNEFSNMGIFGSSTRAPEWYYVAYHGTLGFVHSDYVTIVG